MPAPRAVVRSIHVCAWLFSCIVSPAVVLDAADADQFETEVLPILKNYCLDCHSTQRQKGDLDLERFDSFEVVLSSPGAWEKVAEQLELGEMPPEDEAQPSDAERELLQQWVKNSLQAAALRTAGDPGPVVLRRLNNAEYTFTVRDLTGVNSLDPAKEFPGDSASGEGFMNVGNSLVMSPSLVTKYLDAAKEIAAHAVLLPDGIRFSPSTSQRDWTEELLTEIRDVYREYTDNGGGTSVNLQGIRFDTKDGGVLPLDAYLAATIELRDQPARTVAAVAAAHQLSPKYLATLWNALNSTNSSLLLDPIRTRWRTAQLNDAAALAKDVSEWQHALWKFNSVGHIGKRDGPKSWMEPLTPIQSQEELRVKMPAANESNEVTLYLVATDAGDGNNDDIVVWDEPRFVAPGQPPLLLRDLRPVSQELAERRERVLADTARYLNAAAEVMIGQTNFADLARQHELDQETLEDWLDYLGVSSSGPVKLQGHFTETFTDVNGYAFISGWGPGGTPNLTANSSDQHVRIPGNMKPHSVAVHPSPQLAAAVGWRSPVAGRVRIDVTIQHAHPECGNGVTWSLELRRGSHRQRLASGAAHGGNPVVAPPVENLTVHVGDVVSLLIGARNGNHSCDLTAVDFSITADGAGDRNWDLAKDVSPDVRAGNPHADRFGNEGVWHFYAESVDQDETGPVIPADSLLAKWQTSDDPEEKRELAGEVQKLLTSTPPENMNSPDAMLHRQLTSLGGPLFNSQTRSSRREEALNGSGEDQGVVASVPATWGLDPAMFGKLPDGSAITDASLGVHAPAVVEFRVPAELVAGYEFVTTGRLDPNVGADGSVQLLVSNNRPALRSGLLTIAANTRDGEGPWYSNNRVTSHDTPIVVNEGSDARRRIEADFDAFRQLFPAALCYTKIVPVDEVVTLTLYYREDDHFQRLMLDDAQAANLNRRWEELRYVSQDALKLVDVFEQLWQYATQDADPSVFEPMREPIKQRAAAFRQRQLDSQPAHLEAVLEFAERAFRRPLTAAEQEEVRALYRKLRAEELSHEQAIRLALARTLVAPAFLYKLEEPPPGGQPGPVDNWELATRLSYFLWSSMPDAELRAVAANGELNDPDVLAAQISRMLRDPKVRRLATEFGCAWLHVHGFDELDEKSPRHFPTFAGLRDAMYEEAILFFTDLFQEDASLLNLIDADYTFLNEELAMHYGIPESAFRSSGRESAQIKTGSDQSRLTPAATSGNDGWRKVDGVNQYGRGGILGLGATLAKQSGASRTSPILRGNWVAEVILGDKLPRPPKDVPQLPEDEATESMTVRELTEKHSSDPRCYGCHRRIDGYGFALEAYDAIGRLRAEDLGGRPIETRTTVFDGTEIADADGLRDYLLTTKRDTVLRQFNRKLLGYALGRSVMLSDRPLLDEMQHQLEMNDYRISAAIETIVRSQQFREIRGKEMAGHE